MNKFISPTILQSVYVTKFGAQEMYQKPPSVNVIFLLSTNRWVTKQQTGTYLKQQSEISVYKMERRKIESKKYLLPTSK